MSYNIAIDGPAGAGKSTVAKKVAEKLGFIYVDTGAMYRAFALYVLNKGIDPEDPVKVAEATSEPMITIRHDNGVQCVYLNGENVNDRIRTGEVSDAASKTSAVREVRLKLVALQQELAKTTDVVMDGRDIGTAVLPDADLKIFLTASEKVRAKRRYEELKAKGVKSSLSEIEKEILERDERDMNRKESPLVRAEDAIRLDTSEMTIDEVVSAILAFKEEKELGEGS